MFSFSLKSTLLDLPSEFVEIDEDSDSFLWLFRMVLVSLQSRSGGNLSRIFFGLRHHNCSGRMQFQSTQGNHSATPISMVRNTISCVLRLVKFTLKKIWKFLLLEYIFENFKCTLFSKDMPFFRQLNLELLGKSYEIAFLIIGQSCT